MRASVLLEKFAHAAVERVDPALHLGTTVGYGRFDTPNLRFHEDFVLLHPVEQLHELG
jgi:hypothetical protein